jgi:hypothetical protein
MAHNITDEDEGKKVVDATGEKIGIVSGVRGGTAYVDPDPGLAENLKSRLGWGDVDQDDYPLEESHIETVMDDEIRLGSGL